MDDGGNGGVELAVRTASLLLLALTVLVGPMGDRCDAAFLGLNGRIAYSYSDASGDSIRSVNADGGVPVGLNSGSGDHGPVYSADGEQIAFERGNGVFVMSADGSVVRQLLTVEHTMKSEGEWLHDYETPEGETVPFVKVETELGVTRFSKDPSFSSDGTELALVEAVEKTSLTRICAVEASGAPECLPAGDPNSYFDTKFECICTSQVVTVGVSDGKKTGAITEASPEANFEAPTYAGNGALAFVRSLPASPGSAIFVIQAKGEMPVQVTPGLDDNAPDFSPNGSRIVFTRGGSEIGLVGVHGGLVTILPLSIQAGSSGNHVESPRFSPDGTAIVFGRSVSLLTGVVEAGIYTMAAGGSSLSKVVDGGSAPSWQPTSRPSSRVKPIKVVAPKAIRLSKRHRAVIATISCGSSRCRMRVARSELWIGGKACAVRTMLARRAGPGKKRKLRVEVRGRCLLALARAGDGTLRTTMTLSDALWRKAAVPLKTTLLADRATRRRAL
jgi:hypothetical protein